MRWTEWDNAIRLDLKVPPCYGFVRSRNGSYATVTFGIKHTSSYNEKSAPLLYWDYDERDYYMRPREFYAEINDRDKDRIGIAIHYRATPNASPYARDERIYLTEKEQDSVVRKLNAECRRHYGKNCKALLKEARMKMGGTENEP